MKPQSTQPVVVVIIGLALLLAVMWVANQTGLAPAPDGAGRFAATILVIADALPALAVMWLGAAGFGWPLVSWLTPRAKCGPVVQIACGWAVMMLLGYVAGWAGFINQITAWTIPSIGVVMLMAQTMVGRIVPRSRPDNDQSMSLPWTLILWAPGLALLLVAATCPPGTLWNVEARGYDVMSYHLQIPREWLAAGAMIPLEHNVYSYLPGLVESVFYQFAAMRGSVRDAVYTCQLFSVSMMLLAAWGIASAAATFVDRAGAAAGGALFLAVPWVTITGSMAYNEAAVLALGAAAVALLFDPVAERGRGAALIGLLVGAATLCKLTAGPMLALPIGVLLVTRLNHAIRWRAVPSVRVGLEAAAVATVIGCLVLMPYLIRNAAWTGNPVFPFAKSVFGTAHWDADLADRWDRGHGITIQSDDRPTAFVRQWLVNTGYGAFGGRPTPHEADNVARFPNEFGAPILWAAFLVALLLSFLCKRSRRAGQAMLAMLGIQLAFWLVGTHLQSRFLLPTLIPTCVLLGIGLGRLNRPLEHRLWWMMPLASIGLVLVLGVTALTTLWSQTQPARLPTGELVPLPVFALVDAMNRIKSPLAGLPEDGKTLVVADNMMLLYHPRPFAYASAFDRHPLTDILETSDDPPAVTAALRDAGYTHVYIGWSELDRLHRTYGFDDAVTADRLQRIIREAGWRPLGETGSLFRLPTPQTPDRDPNER